MYLKSIEIQGFKSFANKIRFEFQNGITGIVGPNGSGKSNVADAVRWVLGEQRIKQLRGTSMQDVIFAGTELRKPLGYAYVAITLDNSDHELGVDYQEVTVARRIYRSGESEYLLNGVQCRLKDINEIFYDTGIGKEGYSIIGQGQIDKILSDKPEDRRELFDEAAGIVKFKRRKDQSVKKLESEKANLTRVSDILSELEKQVGPLERQAEKARVYLKTREQLRDLDVNIFLIRHGETAGELETLDRNLEIAEVELLSSRTEYESAKVEYTHLQEQLEALEREVTQTRDRLAGNNVIRTKLENDIQLYEEQIRSASSNSEHMKNRKSAVEEELQRRLTEENTILSGKKQVDDQLSQLQDSRNESAGQLAELTQKDTELSEKINTDREALLETLNQRANIKSRLSSLTTQEEQLRIRKAELTGKLLQAQTDESRQDEFILSLKEQFEEITRSIAEMNAEQERVEKEIAGKKEQLTDADQGLREAQYRYQQERSRQEALINLTERYEGFGGSVRRVMDHRKNEPGILGVVADLFTTDSKYETAIEVALGGNIQNVVTEDEATAKRMIAMLKSEKAGRATFLPLTSMKEPQLLKNREILREPGVVGTADELIRTDEKFQNAARSLLARTVVVDSFDHAAAIGRKYHHSVRMVTLDGEQFSPGGAISGGTYKNSSNLLGRRRELEELEKSVRSAAAGAEECQKRIERIKRERNELRAKLESGRLALQNRFLEQNTIRANIIAEQEKKEESSGNYDLMREENEEILRKTEEITAQKEEINAELIRSEQFEQETTEAVQKNQEQLDEIRRQAEEKTAVVSGWDLEIDRILQKEKFEQENLDRISAERARFEAELEEIIENLAASEEEIQNKTRMIEQTRETIQASREAYTEEEESLHRKNTEKAQKQEKQKAVFEKRESLNETISALDKELFRLKTRKERVEEQIDSRIRYMWEEYEITLSEARKLRREELTDIAEMEKQAGELKNQIRGLGNVNVNAIEESREVSERYHFMKEQHDDLVAAAAALEKIILELDESMRKQFRIQFARINKEFDVVFKEMFGGGSGSLELMEGEDILEAGVRVIAQPPGKKLQNMMQMSGGEKALTAIALLFAIQNLKPSPFCLLDEIEAALDESNVSRFAQYLHKLTCSTQFIVITHRRGTMEQADQLYGITMQEKGVSALVSVDLVRTQLSG